MQRGTRNHRGQGRGEEGREKGMRKQIFNDNKFVCKQECQYIEWILALNQHTRK